MAPPPKTKLTPADEKASNEAWQRIEKFFADHLRGPS
jgi:hypothetical protein